ncbi:MAG: hypothetical protein QGD90_12445 [Candidatus Hydrogenedentes bacterium]|nr:hypothetical protein [Candidatus Hydrogenedentota bacterium]
MLTPGEDGIFSLGDEWNYLLRLIDFELRVSDRYRRYLSLTMIVAGNGPVSISKTLEDALRISDELVDLEGSTTLLMPETDVEGAMTAVGRFKRKCNGTIDLRFAVVSFPRDGKSTGALVDKAVQRLEKAKAGAKGEVVASG